MILSIIPPEYEDCKTYGFVESYYRTVFEKFFRTTFRIKIFRIRKSFTEKSGSMVGAVLRMATQGYRSIGPRLIDIFNLLAKNDAKREVKNF